jgi:hypothetical protein
MRLGWLVASEPLTIRVVMASAVILAAIVLVRRGERSAVPRSPSGSKVAVVIQLALDRSPPSYVRTF